MMKKTNAKRVLAAALAGMMALSLSACGEQGGGSPTESGDKSGSRGSARVTGFREKRRGGNRRRRPPGGCVPGGLGGYAEGACLWNNLKLSV